MTTMLNHLLDVGEQFDPYYVPSFNSDHLPMTLVALSELGAEDDVLVDFQKRYSERLRPVQSGPKIASLEEGRGRFDAFQGLRELLKVEVEAEGYEAVVARYLPELLPSLAAGAFHPLIRLGFAIRAEHPVEVATSLAHWMTSGLKPQLEVDKTASNLDEVLKGLAPVDLPAGRFGEGLYKLVEQNRYPKSINTTLEDCADASLKVFQGTRNFFALHFVTGTQAARVCAPFVEMVDLVAALSAAIQAGYLVVGAPKYEGCLPPSPQLDEEHSLKYVYACRDEYLAYGDERYLEEIKGFIDAGLVPGWVAIPNQ